jgi:hypothetical protein
LTIHQACQFATDIYLSTYILIHVYIVKLILMACIIENDTEYTLRK